ncbi:MAG: sulfatase activating formylglycine-generating enzyme [Gammaproteobacteria bacterium]|jgi:formylglycine-generating enzyme required for sulfatase activity
MLALPSTLLLFALLPVHSLGQREAAQDEDASKRGVALDDVEESPSSAYGQRHALVIGIDEYEDAAFPDLGYAVADARAVAKLLIESYGFEEENVRLIVNEDATKVALDKALEEWACDPERVGEEDLFVLFYAGHGVTRPGRRQSRGYMVPVDGQSESNGAPSWSSLIGMNSVEDISEIVPAKHALFILDCCFGGLAVTRAAPPIAAGLSSRARQVITAGNSQQAVLDAGGGGHSVFTGALLDGLEGDADLDGDQVVTFGELFNHVGREVERITEKRQTPLQATFPDHEGGNVALFSPDVKPGRMTAAQRLKGLERTADERLAELERLSDYILVLKLASEEDALWPQVPELVPRYRDWLVGARALLDRRAQHEASVQQVRQEAYLSQVVAGQVAEGEGTEPVWDEVDPKLTWRYETFRELVVGLDGLESALVHVERRLEVARTLRQVSIDEHADAWDEALAAITEHPDYEGLQLTPQLGLVPLGPDPDFGLWEFAHVLSGEVPQRGVGGALLRTEATGLVFVLIPGGTFWMGAQTTDSEGQNYDPQAAGNEGPVHEVRLSPYFLSKYEMTQGQWERFVGVNPSQCDPGSNFGGKLTTRLHPVEQVNWDDCVRVLGRLDLVLPSEAQWEYGARAFTDTPWSSGTEKEALALVANLADAFARANGANPDWICEPWSDGYTVHAPVGSFAPNEFGLHDVYGNVWEWCLDGYDVSHYGGSPPKDPVSPFVGSAPRVYRGGGYRGPASTARSADRRHDTPTSADGNRGFRPARLIVK